MKALCIGQRRGPAGLAYEDAPDPEPATGDVLVESELCRRRFGGQTS